MSGINVNVSVDKLQSIKDYVDDFQKNVNNACLTLESEANKLKQHNSAEDIESILSTVNEVKEIITAADQTFKELQSNIENYINFINRLKSITGSK